MASKQHHITIAGLNDLRELLYVIQNKDEYLKLLDEIEVKKAEAEKIVSLVGPAEEIESLLSSAKYQKESAVKLCDEAQTASSRLIEQAKVDSKKIVEDAKGAIGKKMTSLDIRLVEIHKREMEDRSRSADLLTREEKLAELEIHTARLNTQAMTLKADLEKKLAKLKTFL